MIPNPLVNQAITINLLAGITGSSSGGMSIALAAMSDTFIASANAAHIPLEVMHRVAAMAAGGMDTLPHNGAVIFKILAAFFAIGVYYLTGLCKRRMPL